MDRGRGSLSSISGVTTPLMHNGNTSSSSGSGSEGSLQRGSRGVQGAARYLRRAGSRRLMREPSMLVRESAAEQLEERQSDWAYSRPVVVLDLIWNLAFVLVSLAVLALSKQEKCTTPLRVWILGYALQCILHMLCVCCEYRRRQQHTSASPPSPSNDTMQSSSPDSEQEAEPAIDEDAGPIEYARSSSFSCSLSLQVVCTWIWDRFSICNLFWSPDFGLTSLNFESFKLSIGAGAGQGY